MNKEQATGHLLIFTSALIFGLNYPISKWLLTTYLTPEFYMCARMIVSCALFWGLSLCVPREKLSLKEIGIFLLCSVGGVTGNQLLFVWGLDMTSPIDASVITSGRPIIVLLLSALILRERITRLKTAGVLLGAAGAIWLILLSGTSGGNAADSCPARRPSRRRNDFRVFRNIISRLSVDSHGGAPHPPDHCKYVQQPAPDCRLCPRRRARARHALARKNSGGARNPRRRLHGHQKQPHGGESVTNEFFNHGIFNTKLFCGGATILSPP